MISTLESVLNPLKANEKIVYEYESRKNGTWTTIGKRGVFVSKVKHPRKYWTILHHKQMAVVMFSGNKNESRVLYYKLRRKS